MVGRIRWINVGILILLLHSDICRTHLEVYHAGLYPPTIAGIVLSFTRGKYLAGGHWYAPSIALQILSNHVTDELLLPICHPLHRGAYFEDAWRNKTLPQFFKASGVLVVAALIGISVNLSNLYHTYEYSKETMRDKSELVETGDAAKTDQ